jgi:hypothetical protein
MTEGTPPEPRSSFPAGARCAHHPERLAERTCARCGNYMCQECSGASSSTGTCLSCASREGASGAFPYSRDNFTFDGLLNLALSRWKQHWLQLALAYGAMLFCMYVPVVGLTLAAGTMSTFGVQQGDLPVPAMLTHVLGQLIALVAQLASQLVMFGYSLDLLENKPAGVARALERLKSLPAALLQLLLIYGSAALCAGAGYLLYRLLASAASAQIAAIAVGLFALLLVPVVIYIVTGLVFTLLELAHEPTATVLSALQMSWRLAHGRRWQISGVLFVAGLIGGAGLLACCVGLLATAPLGTLLYGALFLALKQPTPPNARLPAHEWPV